MAPILKLIYSSILSTITNHHDPLTYPLHQPFLFFTVLLIDVWQNIKYRAKVVAVFLFFFCFISLMLSSDILVPIRRRCTPSLLKPHLILILFNQLGWMSKLKLRGSSCPIHLQDARTIMHCLINKILKSHSPTFTHNLMPVCVHARVFQNFWAQTRDSLSDGSTSISSQLVKRIDGFSVFALML